MDTQRTPTKDTDINLLKNLNEKQRRDHYIRKNHIDLYNRIVDFNKSLGLDHFTKIIYHYVNDINVPYNPCRICNKETKFKGFNKGYNTYCSNKCAMSDSDVVKDRNDKSVKTCINKYGVSNPSKLDSVKEKIRQTNIDKWGVSSYTKTDEYKDYMISYNNDKYGVDWYQQSDEFRKKTKETNIEKRGVQHHTKSNEFKEEIKEININKWGVDNYSKTDEFSERMSMYYDSDDFKNNINEQRKKRELKIIEYYSNYNDNYDFLKLEFDDVHLHCKECNSDFDINKQLYYLRTKREITCCTICNPKDSRTTSIGEKEVLSYISSIYSGEIIENYRDGLELDIYLPEFNLGFEYNGLWYHSEFNKDKNYHLDKLNHFADRGIRTYTIWEDDWLYKGDIVKSMISNLLLLNDKKIMARKCKLVELDNKITNEFLENNHIQGKSNSSVRMGLYHNNELVSVMTFGKLRKSLGYKSEDSSWELIRFCNKLNTTVIGGASKLLKYFINEYLPKYLMSYADKSRSIGHLYDKLGFMKISDTNPGYFWCKSGLKYNRYSFRKDILVKRGYDKNKTEVEIMHELNYYRVYNCGNIKFELNI